MTLKDLLEFKLIHAGTFSLTTYHLMIILIIIFVIRLLLFLIHRLLRRQELKERIDFGTSHAIYQIIKYILWFSAIAFSLETIGIKITFLLASSAALLVGLGLGLQQLFQDFVSGIALLIEGTLKVGDVVQTFDGEVSIVKEIGMRTSKLETRDNIILIVPNSKLVNEIVINWSHREMKTRFSVKVGVAYGTNVELVKKVLLECASNHKSIVSNPKPIVRFIDFGNSSLDFELLFWTIQTFRVEDVKSDLRFLIDAAFKENNIRIPFPQRDVHIIPEK